MEELKRLGSAVVLVGTYIYLEGRYLSFGGYEPGNLDLVVDLIALIVAGGAAGWLLPRDSTRRARPHLLVGLVLTTTVVAFLGAGLRFWGMYAPHGWARRSGWPQYFLFQTCKSTGVILAILIASRTRRRSG